MENTVVSALRCESRENPIGIDRPRPHLSWKLVTDRRGARQVAYRIVADSLWDSGRVESDRSVHVPWEGPALSSSQLVTWRVTVWDETGAETTSEPAFFEMGLLRRADWRGARWIGGPLVGGPKTPVPLPLLRRTFTIDRPVVSARLTATALGIYEAQLNGIKAGDAELAPGWTDFAKRVRYQTLDVTERIRSGENTLTAELGDGWYCGQIGWRDRGTYGDRPVFLALLVVTHDDGSETVVRTDRRWEVGYGPRLQADLLMGEHFDARIAWDGWQRARLFTPPATMALVAQNGPVVRATQELSAARDAFRAGDGWVIDLGQNLVGRVRLRVKGAAGTTIRLRYAEVLEGGPKAETGPIYTTNLRAAANTDYYTMRGDEGGEIFETRFTFHGFRYVEVSGLSEPPNADTITAIVLHSDTPKTGDFACSDPLVNQLQQNIDWGQRGNFLDIPTDCPQRDERLGWTGDAQVFVRTAAFNRDVEGFFHKWMQDMRDSQGPRGEMPPFAPNINLVHVDGGPAWADAAVICPWIIYLTYGDTAILEENYDAMKRFVDFWIATAKDSIRCYPGYDGWMGFGDWLALDGSGKTDGGTPKDLIGTAFLAYSARLFARIAAVLGKAGDATKYRRVFETTRAVFQKRYVTPDGLIAPMTQTAGIVALYFDLLPEALREKTLDWVVRDIVDRGYKTSTGFVGSSYVPHVLTSMGRADIAYRLLFQKGWPSYLYAVTQGATTIWERWDGWTAEKGFQDPGMNSFNHYAYGAVGAWLYQRVAGIDLDDTGETAAGAGYKRIVLHPIPPADGSLTRAAASLESVYGRIESAWRIDDGRFVWEITVPPNTTATAIVPVGEGQSATLDDAAQTARSERPGQTILTLVPGRYTVTVD
jgi:alpha-L-rhamnosidase